MERGRLSPRAYLHGSRRWGARQCYLWKRRPGHSAPLQSKHAPCSYHTREDRSGARRISREHRRASPGVSLYGWSFSAYMLATITGLILAGDEADRKGPAYPFMIGVS